MFWISFYLKNKSSEPVCNVTGSTCFLNLFIETSKILLKTTFTSLSPCCRVKGELRLDAGMQKCVSQVPSAFPPSPVILGGAGGFCTTAGPPHLVLPRTHRNGNLHRDHWVFNYNKNLNLYSSLRNWLCLFVCVCIWCLPMCMHLEAGGLGVFSLFSH